LSTTNKQTTQKGNGGGDTVDGSEEQDHNDGPKYSSINAYATMLSRLDTRGYARALMRDADGLVQNILQPMSLPWTHKRAPPVARNIPCDIDDMIEVLTVDEGYFSPFDSHKGGNFGFGQYENGRFRTLKGASCLANSSDLVPSATRRSIDPGIIEMSSVELPIYSLQGPTTRQEVIELSSTYSFGNNVKTENVTNGQSQDIEDDGEIGLRCFQISQALKKRRVEQARTGVRRLEVSVRINSCSSRSTILDGRPTSNNDDDSPSLLPRHLLEATLPLEVQNGRSLSKSKAQIVAKDLGTYDLLYGVGENDGSGQSGNRTRAGRTRLMWTQKNFPTQPKGATTFSSILTGEKLDSGRHKRPRDVLVQLIVDGRIFSGPPKTTESTKDAAKSSPAFQATLDCEQYTRDLMASNPIGMILPVVECIPDSCGTIHVICTTPGRMPRMDVDSALSGTARDSQGVRHCTICLQSSVAGLASTVVEECAICGLVAHIACCLDKGTTRALTGEGTTTMSATDDNDHPSHEWICAHCCHTETTRGADPESTLQKRSSKRSPKPTNKLLESEWKPSSFSLNQPSKQHCAVCSHFGGAMSEVCVRGHRVWAHEVCRIWTNGSIFDNDDDENHGMTTTGIGAVPHRQNCILCNKADDRKIGCCTVKCAAENCHVHVHPMCALLSSLSSDDFDASNDDGTINDESTRAAETAKQNDIILCTQYTLSFAEVGREVGRKWSVSIGDVDHRQQSNQHTTEILPVFFCDIHNPRREPSFYGLPPGGLPAETLRVPPCVDPS
jgi:PHD-zinc-finger like domain